MPSRVPIVVLGLSLLLVSAGLSGAGAQGPNRSPEFFAHQYHAFRPGHAPGYLHGRRRARLRRSGLL